MQKPVSLTYHLLIRLGNRMVLCALTLFKKFFQAESDPKMGFGCISQKLMHYSGLNIIQVIKQY